MTDRRQGLGFVPHGLSDRFVGRRSWSFSSDEQRLHTLTLRHDGADGEFVVVTHIPRRPDLVDRHGQVRQPAPTLDTAAHDALVGYIAADPADRLSDEERRTWIESLLVKRGIFDGDRAGWDAVSLTVGQVECEALVRHMPDGLCLAAGIDGAFLAIHARELALARLELLARPAWLSQYDPPPQSASATHRNYDPRDHLR